ncbi:hypothetical protein Hdeb2414_s0656g00930511 [Helianthus debilis subsp. tardiflorus]
MERRKLGEISIEDPPSVLKLRNELCLARTHTPRTCIQLMFLFGMQRKRYLCYYDIKKPGRVYNKDKVRQ